MNGKQIPHPSPSSSSASASASAAAPPPPSALTRVDGHGFWRSWKRNFQNKLKALLDLIDNSLDAALVANTNMSSSSSSTFVGRVHIYPDDLSPPLDAASTGDGVAPSTTGGGGLCMVNNSPRPIRPLKSVLEMYSSSKVDSGANDIGENGIGLKQSCATLSDLSFVLVCNKAERFVELGIIAESLQLREGPYLPDFRFAIAEDDGDDGDVVPYLKKQMTSIFTSITEETILNVAKCIAMYGGAGNDDDDDGDDDDVCTKSDTLPSFWESLERGIDRLCQQFNVLINDFFDSDYVFAVLLDKLSYGKSASNNVAMQQQAAMDAIQDLREVIPQTYLHVPEGFDFRIGSTRNMREKTVFHYWPQRLVELSTFVVNINENIPWYNIWAGGHFIGALEDPYESTSYKLRVFVGFDRVRINDPDAGKTASLYFYSRHSGRLIKHEQDARNILGLNSGGSTFSSGLTILVDDIDGKLPLNPTKTDIAFAEQVNGETHKCNLFAWVGAVSAFFYNYHLAKFDNKKTILTKQIQDYGTAMQHVGVKNMAMSDFTSFKDCKHKCYGKKSIRFDRSSAKEILGIDTHFKLVCNTHPVTIKSSVATNVASNKRKRDHDGGCNNVGFPIQSVATSQTSALNNVPQQSHSPYFDTNKGQNQVTHQYQLVDLSHMKKSANLLDFQSNQSVDDTNAAVDNDNMVIESTANKQQRLLLLRHSTKCPFDDGKCMTTPYCGEMKKLWKHMARCTDNDCRVAHCFSSKSILSHYRKCKDPQCLSCGPVRKTQESQRRKSQTQSGANDTMVGANGYGMPKSTSDNDMIENQNQFDVSTDANENNMVTESTANDEASPTAGSNESEMLNMSAIDTADDKNDDNESVSSTKSTYKDFCKQLTISLEIKNTRHREDKKEQKRLEQKVSELEREIERQKLEKVMYVRKVSTLEREIEQQKLVIAGLTDVAKPPI